jgi:hypothetical protein
MSGLVGSLETKSMIVGQPVNMAKCFFRAKADGQTDMAINTNVRIQATAQAGANPLGSWSDSNDWFTAPLTGRYFLAITANVINIDGNASSSGIHMLTGGHHFQSWFRTTQYSGDPNLTFSHAHITDLDAGEVCYWYWYTNSGAQADLHADTYLTGYLMT